jgi:hypothetical protein
LPTEKQIAANRRNAQRSTGPRTAAGKLKSSRNALRHGLSGPVPSDPATRAKIHSLARLLVGQPANEACLAAAEEFASAQIELLRIGSVRKEQLRNADLSNFTRKELRRLAALDRYERYALTKRRRSSRGLGSEGEQPTSFFAKTNPIFSGRRHGV